MFKRIVLFLLLPLFLFAATKYYLPVQIESSNGRPIIDQIVAIFSSDGTTKVADCYWQTSGIYYYTTSISAGTYDIKLYSSGQWITLFDDIQIVPDVTAAQSDIVHDSLEASADGVTIIRESGKFKVDTTGDWMLPALDKFVNDSVKLGSAFIAASNAPAIEKALANYVCDGVADQVEINAAISYGYKNIQLSSGKFVLDKTGASCVSIVGMDGVSIKGQGWGTFIQLGDSVNPSAMFKIRGSTNISVSDMFISGHLDSNSTGLCISVDSCSAIQIHNIRADSAAQGHIIGIYGSDMVWVENCYVHYSNGAGHGIDVDKYNSTPCGKVYIRNNTIEGIYGAQKFENAEYVEFSGNWVIDCGNSGVGLVIGSNDNPPVANGSRFFVHHNYVIGGGVQIAETYADSTGVIIFSNNYIEGSLSISQTNALLVQIDDNIIMNDSNSNAVYIPSTNGYIGWFRMRGCYIDSVGSLYDGISLQATAKRAEVYYNSINNVVGEGIVVSNEFARIDNNVIQNKSGGALDGIRVRSDYVDIYRNDIINFTRGIELEGADLGSIFFNRFYNTETLYGSAIREKANGTDYADSNFIAFNRMMDRSGVTSNLYVRASGCGDNSFIGYNSGYTTEIRDTVVLLSTATYVNVALGSNFADTLYSYKINVTPADSLGAASYYYVKVIDRATFRIYVDKAPGNDVTFIYAINNNKKRYEDITP